MFLRRAICAIIKKDVKKSLKMKLNLVVAAASNGGIGIDGKLPWRLKGDMAFFKKITSDTTDPSKINAVIMGRRTWDSIPVKFRPLPNRVNIVLSKSLVTAPEGALLGRSLDHALQLLSDDQHLIKPIENVHIIGGSSVYQAALESPHCHRIYLTNVLKDYQCDTFLPKFDKSEYEVVSDPRVPSEEQEDNDVKYTFQVLQRRVSA